MTRLLILENSDDVIAIFCFQFSCTPRLANAESSREQPRQITAREHAETVASWTERETLAQRCGNLRSKCQWQEHGHRDYGSVVRLGRTIRKNYRPWGANLIHRALCAECGIFGRAHRLCRRLYCWQSPIRIPSRRDEGTGDPQIAARMAVEQGANLV